jgi:hypothetical protein
LQTLVQRCWCKDAGAKTLVQRRWYKEAGAALSRTYVLLHQLPAVLFCRVLKAAQRDAPALAPRQVHCQRINPL